ncbi:MAG: hypothetical protein UU47_C0026G0010 [candidate division TM6 bacterium GW2011_GWE2_41_16]|nr:MAG: hypothetical protein UU47_C0026G0010 [candidate division TM6 bacterium GW2011_GWE2_41_16]
MQKTWSFDPHSDGEKITPDIQKMVIERANAYAKKCTWYPKFQLKIHFRGQFCYLDASKDSQEPFPMGRLRYCGCDEWSFDFYTYSNERYTPCIFCTGEWCGSVEEALAKCSMYLQ